MSWRPLGAILFLSFMLAGVAYAADNASSFAESPQLQKCLKRADDLPDMAAAEATAWAKKGGGNDAHLCRAFAQSNRGMHIDAAREFWALASFYDKHDKHRALLMQTMSGLEFMRGKDLKNAEARYNAALKISPGDVDALVGRAEVRMATDNYWDAIADLDHALKNDPDNIAALRQRGRAWTQLDNVKKAQEDFGRAEDLAAAQAVH